MKKCPFCAEEIQDEAILCRFCGRELPKLAPARLVSVPKAAQKKQDSRKPLLFILGLLSGLCILCVIAALIYNSTPQAKAEAAVRRAGETQTAVAFAETAKVPTATLTPEATATPRIDASIKVIMDGAGLSQSDAEVAFEVIKSIGFTRVDKLSFALERDGMKAYDADLGYTTIFLVTFTGNEIFGISNKSTVFYDKDAGGVLDQITNYTIDVTEEGEFMFFAQEHVKSALKAPSTAKFPGMIFERDQWSISRQKDIVWVQSWVDAQNSFGAQIRSNFIAQYNYSTKDLLYLEIDGNVVFGTLQKP